jgi:hypothetical protein
MNKQEELCFLDSMQHEKVDRDLNHHIFVLCY